MTTASAAPPAAAGGGRAGSGTAVRAAPGQAVRWSAYPARSSTSSLEPGVWRAAASAKPNFA